MKIKKGDKVQVIAGQDRGTVGEVKLVMPRSNRIIVEGVNVRKKHEKPSQIGLSRLRLHRVQKSEKRVSGFENSKNPKTSP